MWRRPGSARNKASAKSTVGTKSLSVWSMLVTTVSGGGVWRVGRGWSIGCTAATDGGGGARRH
jgi:hypothetical protein